jgi:glycosyltransferase involved in cell wall biosynthesis
MNSDYSPLISVIIPCYNYASYLPDSIGSIMNQSYQNWECLIIDDGSTDNSKEIVQQFSAKDSRIKYFLQINSGPTVARNYGLTLAKGQFIQFLDADDLIESRKLETQIAIFKQGDYDIVYGDVKYFAMSNLSKLYDSEDLKSGPWMKQLSGNGDAIILELLKGNIMETSSPLVRKVLFDQLGKMNEELLFNEDWELWARFAIGNARFKFDNTETTKVLRRVHDSYSKNVFKMYSYGLKVSLILNQSVHGRKYRKIMIPKINYHQRILDELLIALLATDKNKAIDQSTIIFNLTGLKRYKHYRILFNYFPVWFCYLYTRSLFIIHKLKNEFVYA